MINNLKTLSIMKRLIIVLFVSVFCAGMSLASFQVKKSQNETTTNSIEQVESDVITAPVSAEMSEVSVISDEPAVNEPEGAAKEGTDGTVAIILALVSVLLLPFGLHNWYLGRRKQALWQTLLVVPGFILLVPPLISWVWQLIDLIRLLISGGTL